MKFAASSTDLLNHLQVVSRVISSKHTLPILDNFLFELSDGQLVIRAADLETTLITKMTVESFDGDGAIAVPAKILLDTLKEFPEQPLTFNIDLSTCSIEILSENGRFNVVGQDADDFPIPKEIGEKNTVLTLNATVLLAGINKTLFATADDEMRPVMNGIFFQVKPESLTFVSSDAHKLVRYRRTDVVSETESSFILHKKPAALLKNMLAKSNEEVTIKFDDKNAIFILPEYQLICCLIEGKYPNYEAVIPTTNDKRMIIDRADFLNAIKRVSVFSNQASNLIKFECTPEVLNVSAQDIDYSISAFEKLRCEYEGEVMEIGFKSTFIMELLANLGAQEVVVEMTQPGRAGVFTPLEKEYEDEDLLMLLMPMMLG